jgi:NADPH:quinone reductase-like Zn-dependent oxidoreductase
VKAYEIGAQDGISALTEVTRPDPVAGPGEAVLKVRLIGLNNRDVQVIEGRYGAKKSGRARAAVRRRRRSGRAG